jgi:primosomal protein N' (replication factor Y) (superfamily II helicase)
MLCAFDWPLNIGMTENPILCLALPTPLRRSFDYLAPVGATSEHTGLWRPGQLFRVPFGNQSMVGLLLEIKSSSDIPQEKLRPATEWLGSQEALNEEQLSLCLWAAEYYHYPIGEAISTALPGLLRQGQWQKAQTEPRYRLTTEGKGLPQGALKRARKQAVLLEALQQHNNLSRAEIDALEINQTIIKTLIEKKLIETYIPEQISQDLPAGMTTTNNYFLKEKPLELNTEQHAALNQIQPNIFSTYLLDGTTGSGKTEIYLQAIERCLSARKQALVLVPEIGLTPQTLSRFLRRFNVPIAALHSGLNDRERLDAWMDAKNGKAKIIIGTRSAIFTPLQNPGMIVIDEEHDLSFKQQEGFRYSARDLAVVRAHKLNIPLILGSATPSLETLHNAQQGRYQHLRLTTRAGNAKPPQINLLDIRGQQLDEGLSPLTLDSISKTLNKKEQVLVFLNRRGYAPTLECQDCGWMADCRYCDARMTLHQSPAHLHCHHCDHQRGIPKNCPNCKSSRLHPLGQGTERSEETLRQAFPDTPVIRIDRDATRQKNSLNRLLEPVHQGEPCILIGTQMLAKGHHFPNVTLVVILDADAGLFSTDFRGIERMGQLLLQVAGRAGRAEKNGYVIVQSLHVDHPWLQTLTHSGYHAMTELILKERLKQQLPPFRHLALLRAESKRPEIALEFLRTALSLAQKIQPSSPELNYLGPLPAMMEKRGDRFRYQLHINSNQRKLLQFLLSKLTLELEASALNHRVRWSIDVDAQDMS